MTGSPLPQDRPLTEADLAALITSSAKEDRHLEFKRAWMLADDKGKCEFLKAVSAFANSRGGDLVLGMRSDNGVAVELTPLDLDNPDQARIQIRDLIRAHIRPPLGGVQVEHVLLTGGKHVTIVRTPKSWAGPHMLNYGGERRFYIRDDAGKRAMEFEEVEGSFLTRESIGARLRNFRMERCAAILNDETPRPLTHVSRIVVHVLPLGMFGHPHRLAPDGLFGNCLELRLITDGDASMAFDLDGLLFYQPPRESRAVGYAQVLRNGAIEAVDCHLLSGAWRYNPAEDPRIPGNYERRLVAAIDGFLKYAASVGVEYPFAVFLTLLNVRGYRMGARAEANDAHAISRDHLFLPELVLNTPPDSVSRAMLPVFNMVWNACGYALSQNFTKDGTWRPESVRG